MTRGFEVLLSANMSCKVESFSIKYLLFPFSSSFSLSPPIIVSGGFLLLDAMN